MPSFKLGWIGQLRPGLGGSDQSQAKRNLQDGAMVDSDSRSILGSLLTFKMHDKIHHCPIIVGKNLISKLHSSHNPSLC